MDTIRHISDEDAILSIDFLAGFTVFILALIMVISLVPGFLAGVQSENIDYDAVAYRTSVILVEDPGAPDKSPWHLRGTYDMLHKDDIQRLGLTVSKDTPNILSREKVDKFFNNVPDFTFSADDYREKVIFGDIPYLYNISLKMTDTGDVYYAGGGSSVPDYQYGYMRRLVKVKEPSSAEIDFTNYPGQYTGNLDANVTGITEDFAVHFPYDELINQSVNPAYRIDPRSEEVVIDLSNLCSNLNTTDIISMNFTGISFYKPGPVEIPGMTPWKNETYSLTVNGTPYPASGGEEIAIIAGNVMTANPTIEVTLYPLPPLATSYGIPSPMDVNFTFTYLFKNSTVSHEYLNGMHSYDYNPANVTQPQLVDGVMEVAIW